MGYDPCAGGGGGYDGGMYYEHEIDWGAAFSLNWENVNVNLSSLSGSTIDIRWRFDTNDGWVNDGEGWYVDDILIEGKGSGASNNAAVVNGVFSAQFDIVEGSNDLTIQAINPYLFPEGSVKSTQTISVSLDTTVPVVNIVENKVTDADTPDEITNAASKTINFSWEEENFFMLTVKNQTSFGKFSVKSIKAASEPENQTSDANVTLWEGENKIEVTVRDGADRRTTAVVYIFKDTIGPTYTKGTTIYPTGVYSARQGDPMIFQIDVADASTDVQCVEMVYPGENTQGVTACDPSTYGEKVKQFKQPAGIPEAVRESWGTTGEWLLPMVVPGSACLLYTSDAADE